MNMNNNSLPLNNNNLMGRTMILPQNNNPLNQMQLNNNINPNNPLNRTFFPNNLPNT